MTFDPVTMDLPTVDLEYSSTLVPFTFDSHGSALLSRFLVAQGKGPHPTVILLHGFPGNEPNFDVAHALCRSGWNVLAFHYRGTWGSPGDFTFACALEDAVSAVEFVSSERARTEFRCDSSNIAVVGHSMGGFIALHTAAVDPRVKGVATIGAFNFGAYGNWLHESQSRIDQAIEAFKANVRPVRGTTSEILIREILEYRTKWNLEGLGDRVHKASMLIQYGSHDVVSVPELHHHPMIQAFKKCGATALRELRYECDHMFTQVRIVMSRELVNWVKEL